MDRTTPGLCMPPDWPRQDRLEYLQQMAAAFLLGDPPLIPQNPDEHPGQLTFLEKRD